MNAQPESRPLPPLFLSCRKLNKDKREKLVHVPYVCVLEEEVLQARVFFFEKLTARRQFLMYVRISNSVPIGFQIFERTSARRSAAAPS